MRYGSPFHALQQLKQIQRQENLDDIELQEIHENETPDPTLPEDHDDDVPAREPKRRRMDVVSLLNPHMKAPNEPATGDPQPAATDSQPTTGDTQPATSNSQPTISELRSTMGNLQLTLVEAPQDLSVESPTNSQNSYPPLPPTPQSPRLFPIFDASRQRSKKRKADKLITAPSEVTRGGAVGTSRSARAARERNRQVREGTFIISNTLLLRFKRKIWLVDPDAAFMIEGNVKLVKHSLCGESVAMKEPYSTGHFHRHIDTCYGPPKSADLSGGEISRFFTRKNVQIQSLPCPGLDGSQHERIPIYLGRSSAAGGGAPSRTIVARELYEGCEYKLLTKAQKTNVRRLQALQFRWINDHREGRVVSARCLKTVVVKDGGEANPCIECLALLRLGGLRNALRRPTPDDKNLKYTPKECLATLIGKLYAAHLGLREIMESPVREFLVYGNMLSSPVSG